MAVMAMVWGELPRRRARDFAPGHGLARV